MNIKNHSKQKKYSSFIPKTELKFYINKQKRYQEITQILRRLYLQTYRRPSSLLLSIVQPLLWLMLFGALFQNAPIYLFEQCSVKYREFLNPGIIVFTGFNSSISAGLPIVFDREFGFLNRILISPISKKNSLIYSCIIHTWTITITQILTVISITLYQNHSVHQFNIEELLINISITTIIIINISNISICNAFILPGHVEFIAITNLLVNLPTLFGSTALAPLSFMPTWLQIISCINPLTYAIEIIRHYKLNTLFTLSTKIINTHWLQINTVEGISILVIINTLSLIVVKEVIKYKYD
uniref:ABC transmembrane type-2 domain-containing protein n=1 Tax=Lophosiphonia teges TaxID=2007110 RepID=A0A1Z1MVZ1_9FLOR|nr:hypothetical protein [Polysiphonia teges]